MVRLALFDYGAGNIFSLKNSFEKLDAQVEVITSLDQPNVYSGILLPGVGNFDPAIKRITKNTKTRFQDFVKDVPVLGICLGMEMFFEKSEEGTQSGLGIMSGQVIALPPIMKVPHMGWNNLEIKKQSKLLDGINDGSWVYFVHSYHIKPTSNNIIMAESDYGIKVPSIVEQDNFIGTQFHPEKSGPIGQIMLKNFLNECKK